MNKIREYRVNVNLTQSELAKKLGITQKAITKWETGKSNPRSDRLYQLAKTFDCSIDDLLCNEGHQDSSNGGSG